MTAVSTQHLGHHFSHPPLLVRSFSCLQTYCRSPNWPSSLVNTWSRLQSIYSFSYTQQHNAGPGRTHTHTHDGAVQSISVALKYCVLCDFLRKPCRTHQRSREVPQHATRRNDYHVSLRFGSEGMLDGPVAGLSKGTGIYATVRLVEAICLRGAIV